MSVTSGFFNSVNGDRKYNAEQMSAIFDGVINDGIFANIGTAFTVSAATGFDITVGIGRAWFNSTWIYNDAILPMTLEQPEVVLDRIDAVVIEVDHTTAVRAASIKIVKGSPASTPQNPTMTHTNYINQYPLAYIYRAAGSTSITQSQITSRIGTSDAPYVTGILQVQNIDNIVAQWGAQWVEWYAATTDLGETEMQQMLTEWNQWYSSTTSQNEAEIESWIGSMQSDFLSWFNDLQVVLDGDVATALAARLLDLEDKFETLAKERAIYVPLEDDDAGEIQDSAGRTIEGRTVFVQSTDQQVAQIESSLNAHVSDYGVHVTTLMHSKEGTVHTLLGIPDGVGIFTAQFKATARFNYGDTFSGGYTAKPNGIDTMLTDGAFVAGDVVSVTIDTEGKRLNFKLGGGVSSTLPPLNPNFMAEYADGFIMVTAYKLSVAQGQDLAGAEWYYGTTLPQRPGDGTKIELTREQLIGSEKPKALSEYAAGDIVKIRENNAAAEFIVAMHNYESSLNGEGRTLLVRKDIYDLRAWDAALQKIYSSSDIDDFANTGYKNLYSAFVQGLMGTTKFPCMSQRGGSVVTIEKSVFILSMTEYGKTHHYAPVEGSALAIAENLLISDYNGEPTDHYTRTITTNDNTSVWRINATGGNNYSSAAEEHGFRPCFTFPSTTLFGSESNELIEDAGISTLADTTNLGDEAAGSTVTLMENGVATEYLVLQQGYPTSGNGNTLLRRKDAVDQMAWDSGGVNAYSDSSVDSYLSGDYIERFTPNMQAMLQIVNISSAAGNGNTAVGAIPRKAFILSYAEVGFPAHANAPVEGTAIPYFDSDAKRVVQLNGVAVNQWTRTPFGISTTNAWIILNTGAVSSGAVTGQYGIAPCIVLKSDVQVNPDGSIVEQETANVTVTIPWSDPDTIFYCRQFPYNSRRQYQTQLVGAVATTDPDYQDGSIPSEPEDVEGAYEFFQLITQTTEWSPSVSGWYSIYCVGKSGNGSAGGTVRRQGDGGPGGGSGGIARSTLYLKTTDVINITINDSLTSFGDYMSATAAENATRSIRQDRYYLGSDGGNADGGNKANLVGYKGGSGGIPSYSENYSTNGTQGGNNGAYGGAGRGSSRYRSGGGGGGARLADTKYTIASLTAYSGGTGQDYDSDGERTPATGGSVYPDINTNPPVLYGGGNGGGGGGAVSSSGTTYAAGTGSAGTPGCIIIEKATS